MFFEDPVFWKCAYIWKTSEEKVSKNTVRTSMRKTCKNHPKNESKTHQKSSKNKPKKTHRKSNDPISTKSARRVTKTRPTREGKGGIQDGILLEKKRILQKPDLLRGKGACWEGYTQTPWTSTRPCGGQHSARGRISVACGNSSAPGPREDNLHAEKLQEIWCQGQCRCIFLQNTALKG